MCGLPFLCLSLTSDVSGTPTLQNTGSVRTTATPQGPTGRLPWEWRGVKRDDQLSWLGKGRKVKDRIPDELSGCSHHQGVGWDGSRSLFLLDPVFDPARPRGAARELVLGSHYEGLRRSRGGRSKVLSNKVSECVRVCRI